MTTYQETAQVGAEDHATGTAWRRPAPVRPCTPKEQAEHWAVLGEVVSGWKVGDAGRRQSYPRRGR